VLYVGTVYTSTAIGARLKTAHCEKCGTEFYYELRRLSSSSRHAPYTIGENRAKEAARTGAQAHLEKSLAHAEDPVPCPSCFWVNTSAIRQYRSLHHRIWYWFAGLTLLFAALIDALLYFDARDIANHAPDPFARGIWITNAFAAVIIVASLLLQAFLRRRFNPNRYHPNSFPRLPPGTPPPLLKNPAGDFYVPQNVAEQLDKQTQWAIFRPGQLAFPPACCICLGAPVIPYKLPMQAQPPLPVPVCRPCLGKIKARFWLLNLVATALAFLLAWWLSTLPAKMDDTGRLIMLAFVGSFLAIIAFVAIDLHLRPYRTGAADKAKAVGKIRFRNPAYTALLIRNIAEAEGTAQPPGSV
jgi:hypothetical protein